MKALQQQLQAAESKGSTLELCNTGNLGIDPLADMHWRRDHFR